jgi:ATP-dependent helicase HrpA
MRAGVVRLLRILLSRTSRTSRKAGLVTRRRRLQLKTSIPTDRLLTDVVAAICDRAFIGDDPLPRSEKAFAEQARRARARLPAVAEGAYRLLAAIAAAHYALTQRLGKMPAIHSRAVAEVRRRRDALVYPGFFRATPWAQLAHLPRYLTALEHRLAKLPQNPERDARHSAVMERWWERYTSGARECCEHRRVGCRCGGARAFPLVARGARRFAVRPGAQDAVSRVREAARKGVGGTLSLTIGALRALAMPFASC